MWTSRKSDATYFTESQLENMRVGVSLQMSGFDKLHIINTDETPLYYNLVSSFALRDRQSVFKLEGLRNRITILPYISFQEPRAIPPAIITQAQGTMFNCISRTI